MRGVVAAGLIAGILPIAGIACSARPATTTSPPMHNVTLDQPPRRNTPGVTVPGSEIALPTRASAGSVIEGTAPADARIEAAGQVLHVGSDRRFGLRIPEDARGLLPVRIVRPDGRTLLLRIEIVRD